MTALRAFVVIGLAGFFMFLVGPSMFQNPPWPYTGITAEPAAGISLSMKVRVAPDSPAYQAGLRTGDAVSCLSARDNVLVFPDYAPNLAYIDAPIHLCARHNGVWRNVEFAARKMPPPGLMYGTPFIAGLRLAVFAVFLFVGSALVLARPSLMTWLFYGYCLANLPWAAPQGMLLWLPLTLYLLVSVVSVLTIWSGPGLLALFTLVVPDDWPPSGWRRVTFRALVAATVLAALFAGAGAAGALFGNITNIDRVFTGLTVLLVIARLATMERHERARFGWAAFAIIFGIICNDVRNVVSDNAISITGGVLTVIMPLCMMYAILRRHVIDVRFVISRTVVYGAITTLVVGVIGLVDWATSAYLSQARVALAIDALVTIALGLALHRCYAWIEYAVDFFLFRKKHEAESYLRRAGRALLRADSEETIDAVLVGDPHDTLDLTMAALFRRAGRGYELVLSCGWNAPDALAFERGHDIVRFLETERGRLAVRDLRKHVTSQFVEAGAFPAIAIPIFRGDSLVAFTLYGLHHDGTQLDPDEIDVLERLCESAAQAYTAVELARYQSLAVPVPIPAV